MGGGEPGGSRPQADPRVFPIGPIGQPLRHRPAGNRCRGGGR